MRGPVFTLIAVLMLLQGVLTAHAATLGAISSAETAQHECGEMPAGDCDCCDAGSAINCLASCLSLVAAVKDLAPQRAPALVHRIVSAAFAFDSHPLFPPTPPPIV